jgi:group I intron endonuclease
MTYFVYKITNLINNKIYIGKANNIKKRLNAHKTAARKKDPNDYSKIHRAFNKYGEENFIIEELGQYSAEIEALQAEKEFIKNYNSTNDLIGYNITEGGEGSSGFKHSEESKEKMSAIKKQAYLGEGNPFYGKTHSEETKEILSNLASQKIGELNPFYGRTHSEESLNKMKENHYNKQKYFSEQDIENIKFIVFLKPFNDLS